MKSHVVDRAGNHRHTFASFSCPQLERKLICKASEDPNVNRAAALRFIWDETVRHHAMMHKLPIKDANGAHASGEAHWHRDRPGLVVILPPKVVQRLAARIHTGGANGQG